MRDCLLVVDFGGQSAHLISSRLRRQNIWSEVIMPDNLTKKICHNPCTKGFILSGGPSSVYLPQSPQGKKIMMESKKPILGICYGHQWIQHYYGGRVQKGSVGNQEFGSANVKQTAPCPLWEKIPQTAIWWMSHGDHVSELATGFTTVGSTKSCKQAAAWHQGKNIYGLQFHPEVTHSPYGNQLLGNFADICQIKRDWNMDTFQQEQMQKIQNKIGNKKVFMLVSGGVDSTVSLVFLTKILGAKRVRGLLVDTGLMRKNEIQEIRKSLLPLHCDLRVIDARKQFYKKLAKTVDPEKKREIIGNEFLQVQREFFTKEKLGDEWLLGQGTIYPDTIETGGTANSQKIKTHHNRVPQIQEMIARGLVVEPLADLYKDEVRSLGQRLKIPPSLLERHPFPGPGLGVRILGNAKKINVKLSTKQNFPLSLPMKSVGVQGDQRTYRQPVILDIANLKNREKWPSRVANWEKQATDWLNKNHDFNRALVILGMQSKNKCEAFSFDAATITPSRVKLLQEIDYLVTVKLKEHRLNKSVWQFPVITVPLSINKKGQETIILRPIDSVDAMSATVAPLSVEFLAEVTQGILECSNVSAIMLDVTSKPPGTVEWE